MENLKSSIRNIPDFPKTGIQFKDITPLLKNSKLMALTTELLVEPFKNDKVTAVVGMEARGFIFGSLCAKELGVGFIPLRKPGKLPYDVQSTAYELEYGEAELEVHIDAVDKNDKVLLVDDLIATGGTAAASCELVEKLGAAVVGCAFVIELDELRGRDLLQSHKVHTLLHY